MGKLMRLYWIPFLLSRDVAADGAPYRVRLLGEDLVAFRDSGGRVGLVDQACPHRGAPLVFGRNEDGGLRCVYHGWKFAVDGACREMPAEGASTPMLKKVRVKAYPVQERNGVLWTYMGPDAVPPPLPSLEWNMVPEQNAHVSMRIQECNWLQALEGEVDSAHAAILHGRVDAGGSRPRTSRRSSRSRSTRPACTSPRGGRSARSRTTSASTSSSCPSGPWCRPSRSTRS
jgi:phthalate 4,5-dioxygenase